MANQKVIPIKIKVDGKEIDLSTTSINKFNKELADAKKKLKELTVGSAEWKTLNSEIKTAEKSMSDYGNSLEDTEGKTKSYRGEIMELTKELRAAKETYGANSDEVKALEQRITGLRDAQKETALGTQELDDALANLPGPIGAVGQAMGQLESVAGSAKVAMNQLGLGFKTFDQIVKTSGVGLLITLIAVLVAALMDAAKSFKPLQDAFAGLKDSVGAIFDALKPVTDFLLNVFVGALNLVADAMTAVAGLFGGVSNGVNQQTLEMERAVQLQEKLFNGLSNSISKNTKEIVDSYTEYKKALLEVSKALQEKTITDKQALDQQLLIELNHLTKIKLLRDQQSKEFNDKNLEIQQLDDKTSQTRITNQRKYAIKGLENEREFTALSLANEQKSAEARVKIIQDNINTINGSDIEGKAILLDALELSKKEEQSIVVYYQRKMVAGYKLSQAEQAKQQAEFNREDIALINERSLKITELTTALIKEENARNVQAAKDELERLKEQQRLELEQLTLAGQSTKKLKEKQAAETKLANEKIRLAQLQENAYLIQLEIDKNTRLAMEAGVGTVEYFKARRDIAEAEFAKEFIEADGNASKIADARTKHWNTLIEIDKEGIQAQINLLTKQYDGLYEGTKEIFDKQRELEEESYKLAMANARGNYDMLEALKKEHVKKMEMIDVSELESKASIEERKANAVGSIITMHYDSLRDANDLYTAAAIKAAGDNAAAVQIIQLEHLKKEKEIGAAEIENRKSIEIAKYQIVAQFGQLLANIADQMMNAAQGRDKAQFESAKKLAKAAVIIERAAAIAQIIASTGIANAKAVAASPLTFGQPWVTINTISAALSIAGVIASGIQQLGQINSTEFQETKPSTSGGGGNGLGRGYADGGLIKGKRHAQGGTIIEAEDGEAVMTRGAVTMFAPMLSMMNQAGGGTSFAPNLLVTRPDNPMVKNPVLESQTQIIKTYVVENELTSSQQRQARLKDLSTL
jgi:hypothetical protein